MRHAIVDATRAGVTWYVWRVVLSPDIPDGLAQVKRWPFRDLVAAHAALDVLELVREHERKQAEREAHDSRRRVW